jgi:hypothetical protein
MANYYASCRTNYFKVKDSAAFQEAMSEIPDLDVIEEEKSFVILLDCPDGGGWPSFAYNGEAIDLPVLVSQHLADNSVAVFIEAGAEKLRYICGYAEAINNKGQRRIVDLNSIYTLAGEIGTATKAEY